MKSGRSSQKDFLTSIDHFGPDFFNRVLTTSSGSLFHSPNFFHRVPISSSGSHFQSLNLFIRVTISSLGSQFQSLQFLHQSPNFFIRVFFKDSISGTGVDMLTCQLSCLIALCLAAELEWKNKNEEKELQIHIEHDGGFCHEAPETCITDLLLTCISLSEHLRVLCCVDPSLPPYCLLLLLSSHPSPTHPPLPPAFTNSPTPQYLLSCSWAHLQKKPSPYMFEPFTNSPKPTPCPPL